MIAFHIKKAGILALTLCMFFTGTGWGQAAAKKKIDSSPAIQTTKDINNTLRHRLPDTSLIAVNPDLAFARISIYKRNGYIYITPTMKNITSRGCTDVDLRFSINNLIHQPFMGVRFDGTCEFNLTGLGFRDTGAASCSISIRITRGCRELNLRNNTETISLSGVGSTARTIDF